MAEMELFPVQLPSGDVIACEIEDDRRLIKRAIEILDDHNEVRTCSRRNVRNMIEACSFYGLEPMARSLRLLLDEAAASHSSSTSPVDVGIEGAAGRTTIQYLMRIQDASEPELGILDDTPIASPAAIPCAGDTLYLHSDGGGHFRVRWRDFIYNQDFSECTVVVRVNRAR